MTRTLTACFAVALAATVSAQQPADAIFKARVEAVRRIDAARQNLTDREAQGEMALHWAEAMDRAARAIPFGHESDAQPYGSWLQANRQYLSYDEPGGHWMLRRDAILNLHRTYQATSAADDIAWLLVTVGLGGECEGYMPCYVDYRNLTYGEYLRLHSSGRHAEEAMEFLRGWIRSVLEEPAYKKVFVPAEQCDALKKSVATLRSAVARTGAYRHEDVTRGLDELLRWCR